MMGELLVLPITAISISGGTQSRVSLNQDAVAEYAEVIRLAGELPPVVVFNDGASDGLWLADGFHRFHAHRAAGVCEISCDVRIGTQRDAILFSVGANAAHGLRRTNEDKRHAVKTLLADTEWSKWSDREISRCCGVSHNFVSETRKSHLEVLSGSVPHRAICHPMTDADNGAGAPSLRTVERNGKKYELDTSKIGKTQAAPTISAPASFASAAQHPVDAADQRHEDFGPSEAEIAAAMADEAEQDEYIRALLANEEDPLAKALADVAQMRLVNAALKSQNDGYQATINEQIRMIKALRSKLDKLERAA